jgi:hypothetical protein
MAERMSDAANSLTGIRAAKLLTDKHSRDEAEQARLAAIELLRREQELDAGQDADHIFTLAEARHVVTPTPDMY